MLDYLQTGVNAVAINVVVIVVVVDVVVNVVVDRLASWIYQSNIRILDYEIKYVLMYVRKIIFK